MDFSASAPVVLNRQKIMKKERGYPVFRANEYVKAESLEEAYQLNQKKSNVLLGGMMWLKMGSNYKSAAIDLSGLGLDYIEEDEEEFRIGCMCSLRSLELHEGLNRYFGGIFRECTKGIVGVQFRNGATVGGSVFGRYGFSDILTCMMMLDVQVELYQRGRISLEEFAKLPYDRDILVQVILKKDGRRAAYASSRRSKTDFPIIACGVAKKGDSWYVSVGARPARAALCVLPAGNAAVKDLAEKAAEVFSYGDNMRAGGEYRRHLAQVSIRRLMEQISREEEK